MDIKDLIANMKLVSGEVRIRKGVKPGWFELVVQKKDGSHVRMIGKEVDKFLSETSDLDI